MQLLGPQQMTKICFDQCFGKMHRTARKNTSMADVFSATSLVNGGVLSDRIYSTTEEGGGWVPERIQSKLLIEVHSQREEGVSCVEIR